MVGTKGTGTGKGEVSLMDLLSFSSGVPGPMTHLSTSVSWRRGSLRTPRREGKRSIGTLVLRLLSYSICWYVYRVTGKVIDDRYPWVFRPTCRFTCLPVGSPSSQAVRRDVRLRDRNVGIHIHLSGTFPSWGSLQAMPGHVSHGRTPEREKWNHKVLRHPWCYLVVPPER